MASEHDDAQEGTAVPVMTTPHAHVAGIVSSLPLETRWRPFTLRCYAGFWLVEFMLKAGFPVIHSVFNPRPTDVLLASFPKSGTTWLKALSFAALRCSDHPPLAVDHPLRHRSPHDCVRFIEAEFDTGDEFEALPSPRLLATHLPYTLLPEAITASAGCRVVYICRPGPHPRMPCPAGPQWQHALRYWEESVKRPDKVLFLKYEEMLLDPERHLRKLAEFMGCGFSDEEEGSGVNESFLRKGVAGDWSNHMTPEMAERLDKIVEDALQGSGLTFESSSSSEIPSSW
nr:unnamed protein product [Digitaria exilis]